MTRTNLTLLTDSYKLGHFNQYPPDIKGLYSYFESREGSEYPYTVFFGLQYYLKKYLIGTVVTQQDIEEGVAFCKEHFAGASNFNIAMWQHIVDEWYGRLPIVIKAVPEGTVVPTGNILMSVESLDDRCAPLVNHLETLLCNLWYPCNVATLSHLIRSDLQRWLDKNSENYEQHLNFMLHDFGARGAAHPEAAGIGGAAHLINFLGTDTIQAIITARDYYNAGICGFSVPATEHSVMTSLGRDGEFSVVDRLLNEYPTGILSVVSDSYDIEHACEVYGTVFKNRIMNRKGKFVIRPDSGDPVKVTLSVLEILEKHFPFRSNAIGQLGYRSLPEQLGLLWGDGIDRRDVNRILDALDAEGYSADNIVFGMGGGLLQKHHRDTQRFAFKTSAIEIDGHWHDIYKDPVHGHKTSKRGVLKLIRTSDGFKTIADEGPEESILETVFSTGELLIDHAWGDIRARAKNYRSIKPRETVFTSSE